MFEEQRQAGMSETLCGAIPWLLIIGSIGGLLLLLVNAELAPPEVLLIYFGPGFLIAGLFVPAGIHSSHAEIYFPLGGCLSAALWLGAVFAAKRFVSLLRVRSRG